MSIIVTSLRFSFSLQREIILFRTRPEIIFIALRIVPSSVTIIRAATLRSRFSRCRVRRAVSETVIIVLKIDNSNCFAYVGGGTKKLTPRGVTDERLNYGILYRLITSLVSEMGILFISPNPSLPPPSRSSPGIRPQPRTRAS